MAPIDTDTFYRLLCEHLGVALVATDEDLNIRIWNNAASRMFGAAADQMAGTPIDSVFPQEARDLAGRLLRRAFETGETLPFEFRHRDARGFHRELIATFAPVAAETGERIGVSASVRDITKRIELQQELDDSRKMASLGELAGAIAHHFNNILGGIITSADYAGESGDPDTMARVLKQTGQALLRASRLVNGLLVFAEGDHYADDLSDLTEIVLTLVDDLERELVDSSIVLAVDLPKLPVIPVARAQVATILRNITRNAIEAMPDGGTLGIEIALEDNEVAIEVTDTGRGLDEAAKGRVFEPFWTTKAKPLGKPGEAVGLGLAIAHGLAQVFGGSISVSSRLNEGSRFRLTIPRSAGG